MVHIKIEEKLVKKIRKIVNMKNPLRSIKTDSMAIKEALICYILENEEFLE